MSVFPGSAQSLTGVDATELNSIVEAWDGIASVEVVNGPEFPVSGDETTKAKPFYASIERSQRAGRTVLQDIIAETHAAKEKAGREQHAKTSHPS